MIPAREAIVESGIPLNGLSAEWASLYGLPHLGARYRNTDVNSHGRLPGAICAVCGGIATDVHHWPPKSKGRTFAMRTPKGIFLLKPSLFALCHRCHMLYHGDVGRAPALNTWWEWNDMESALSWYSGELLSHGMHPHSGELFRLGTWRTEGADG